MLISFFVQPIRNLWRGERTAIAAAIIGVVAGLLFAIGVTAHGQESRVPNSRVQWRAEDKWPGWIGLWIDGSYAGSLQPYEGKWWYQGATTNNDLIEFLDRHNPPKRRGERGTGEKIGDIKQRAGVREDDEPPIGDRNQGPRIPPDGVMFEKIAPDGQSHYSIGGTSANRADALRAIEAASGIPDDRTKPRLIVIGNEAGRRKVVDDLARDPLFTYWRDKLVVLSYPTNHDAIAADRGFVQPTGDEPVIQVQGPDGVVFWRQETYTGASDLAKALRDKVPGYDPARDPHPPDKGKPATAGDDPPVGLIGAWLGSVGCPLTGFGALVVGVVVWIVRRAKAGA